MKHFEIYEPVFKACVYFVLAPSEEKLIQHIREVFKIEPEGMDKDEMIGDSHGMITIQEGIIFLWINTSDKKKQNISTLVHETQHLAVNILGSKGIKLDENSQEVFAHYQQHLFDVFLECLERKK